MRVVVKFWSLVFKYIIYKFVIFFRAGGFFNNVAFRGSYAHPRR
jgi:hypothetical protein